MKIDWRRKLTSRKFWAAITGFITSVMIAVGVADATVTQTAAVVMAGATLIAYIIGEGMTDAAGVSKDSDDNGDKTAALPRK